MARIPNQFVANESIFAHQSDEVTIISFKLDTVKNQIEVVKKIKEYFNPTDLVYRTDRNGNAINDWTYYIKEIYGCVSLGDTIKIGRSAVYHYPIMMIRLIKTIRGRLIPAQVTPERIEWEE
jgi:hypothetical protein